MADLATSPEAWFRLLLARAVEVRHSPVPCIRPGATPAVVAHMRARAGKDGLLINARHEMLHLEDDASRTAVAMMDGRASRAQIAERLRAQAGPGARVRKDLDDLIDALAMASLFVSDAWAEGGEQAN